MTDDRRRILEMLTQGKITVAEAEQLLTALGNAAKPSMDGSGKARFLRVLVQDENANVNIRVPLQLLRAGMKLTTLIPKDAEAKVNDALAEKGIQATLADFTPETLEDLISGLNELTVDIADKSAKVRVFCE